MVGVAELPVENTFVFTACLGITGAGAGGRGSNFLAAMATVGAGSSCTFTGVFGWGAGNRRASGGRVQLGDYRGLPQLAQRLRLMIDRNRSADQFNRAECVLRSSDDVGYNKRTQIRSATTAACMPVLKTNSVQGVLVSGSREKRVSWEAEELIAAITRPSFKPRLGAESFSAPGSVDALGLQGVKAFIVYYLRAWWPVVKICTAKAISSPIWEVYPADLSVTYADRAYNRRGPGKKEQKITPEASLLLPGIPTPLHGAGLAAHNLGTIDPLGGIAGVDDQLGFCRRSFCNHSRSGR